jgi:hypothetical protein
MAKFDPQQIMKNFQKNSEYGVIALLVVVAVLMIIILNHRPVYTKPEPKPIDIKTILMPKEAKAEIKRAVDELVPLDKSSFQKDLLGRNLFSFRDVLSKQAQAQEIENKLKQAQTLFDQGSYQQAVDLCDTILTSEPEMERARTLKDKAQKALLGTTPSVTTTASTTVSKTTTATK